MNKDAVKKLVQALEGTEYVDAGPGFMRTERGWSVEGVFTDLAKKEFGGEWVEGKCWCPALAHLFVPHLEFVPKGAVVGSAYLPSDEAIKWLDLKCRLTDYKIIPEASPTPGRSRDMRGRIVECIKYGNEWELKNDPHIDHCATCEGNNFFNSIIEPAMTFKETAKKIRKLCPDLAA